MLVGVLHGLGRDVPPSLSSPDSLTTAQVSEIVASSLAGGQKALVLENLDKEVCAILIHICLLLSERAALMVAVPMATFLNRMARQSTTIAVTGSLYRLHPTLASRLDHYTKILSRHPFCYRSLSPEAGTQLTIMISGCAMTAAAKVPVLLLRSHRACWSWNRASQGFILHLDSFGFSFVSSQILVFRIACCHIL